MLKDDLEKIYNAYISGKGGLPFVETAGQR